VSSELKQPLFPVTLPCAHFLLF